ncbi:MAG: cobalamin biosynthesis protein [Succinivibrio sp.]
MPVEQIFEAAKEASAFDILSTFISIIQYPALTLLLAMLLEIVLPIKDSMRLSRLSPLFSAMARRVNRAENTLGQNVFSSVFLPFFILCISIFTVLLLRFIIGSDTVVSLMLLPFLLESKPLLKRTLEIRRQMSEGNKNRARKELENIVLRKCSNLSSLGIYKANCEAVSVGLFINWFSVMVWYMLLGIEGAVIMQTVSVMTRSFSHKEQRNEMFGSFVYRFEQALIIPSLIAFSLMMFASIGIIRIIRNLRNNTKSFTGSVSCVVLELCGSYANISLGGPRYYEDRLVRLPKFGGQHDADMKSPIKIYNKIRFSGILFVCACVLVKIFINTDH